MLLYPLCNRLNRKRVKHRLEFDSGGRKWINLDGEKVRLQIYGEEYGTFLRRGRRVAPGEARRGERGLATRFFFEGRAECSTFCSNLEGKTTRWCLVMLILLACRQKVSILSRMSQRTA